MFWKVYQKYNININRKSETPGNFGCPKGILKSELFSQGTYHSQNFRYETSKSPILKKLSMSLLSHFVWKSQTIEGTFLPFSLRVNEYEWMYDWTLMNLKDFRKPLLSLELIYFRSSFCYRIENSWGFRYKSWGYVGPLGKNLNFFCLPWDRWHFKIFWAFCLYWNCPTQNLSITLWIMPLMQILNKLWSFIIWVTRLLKQTLESSNLEKKFKGSWDFTWRRTFSKQLDQWSAIWHWSNIHDLF